MITEVEKFWNTCHDSNIKISLSGCQYDETIDFLKIRDYVTPGCYVLEMGVGLGYVTKGLYDNKTIVSCLDISNIGVERVKNYCEATYLVNELDKIPSNYFDVIICNNVVQHIPTDLLINELSHCVRALKTSGIFAIEFVSNDVVDDTGIDPSLEAIKGGVCCRKPLYLKKLIEDIGGSCKLVFDVVVNFGMVKGHHVFHVRRN